MTTNELLTLLESHPETVNFEDVIRVIDTEYSYTPSRFTNGKGSDLVVSEAETNEGSCKIFAFAKLNQLSKQQTLACFGRYYREDVLQHPDNTDHANIRNLIKYSLDDIQFDTPALTSR